MDERGRGGDGRAVVVRPVEESGSGGDGRAAADLAGVGIWQGRGRMGGARFSWAVLDLVGGSDIRGAGGRGPRHGGASANTCFDLLR
jgi:hypothetical protein